MRAFQVHLTVADDLSFSEGIFVEDDQDVRFHDVAIVVERYLANLRACGSTKVKTKSQLEAEAAKLAAANAILKEWDPTNDGINVEMSFESGAQNHTRTWTKRGCDERVTAPCNADGGAAFDTADVLKEWVAPEPQIAEA